MLKIVSWNIAHRVQCWRHLLHMDADAALLQEASEPPTDVAGFFDLGPEPWHTAGAGMKRLWRTAVVGIRDRARIERLKALAIQDASPRDFAVSRFGTLTAAIIEDSTSRRRYTVVSAYAPWERPHLHAGGSYLYSDASAHRAVSDLSVFVSDGNARQLLVAGDLNILHGYGEHGNPYWARRYQSVFDRFESLGLRYAGPRAPNGRQAEPWPKELPPDSLDVPTFYARGQKPATATRQLDFVFVSPDLSECVQTRALNNAEEWGPSDHCAVEITIE